MTDETDEKGRREPMTIHQMHPTGPRTPSRGSGGVTTLDPQQRVQVEVGRSGPFRTVVWNDPVNLMSYVVHVFRSYFGYSRAQAIDLMKQVHENGRAVVSRGSREKVESDVQAMHAFGLRATIEQDQED